MGQIVWRLKSIRSCYRNKVLLYSACTWLAGHSLLFLHTVSSAGADKLTTCAVLPAAPGCIQANPLEKHNNQSCPECLWAMPTTQNFLRTTSGWRSTREERQTMSAALKHPRRQEWQRYWGKNGTYRQIPLIYKEICFRATEDWTLLVQYWSHWKMALLGNNPRGKSPPQKGTDSSWVALAFKPLSLKNFTSVVFFNKLLV